MGDKLMRDEMLRSHRYQSTSNDTTKLLFVHLVLSSDSLSNAEATTTALSIIMGRAISEEAASTMLDELAGKDLLRPYIVDGKRYVHIPRSRQRIRYLHGKHPRPPPSIEDKEIRALIAKVGLKSDRGQVQDARSEAVAVAVLKKSSSVEPVDNSAQQSTDNAVTWAEHWKAKGKALGIESKPGESTRAYCDRVIAACKPKSATS